MKTASAQSDYLIDIGPGAGAHGGNVMVEGTVPIFCTESASAGSIDRLDHDQISHRRIRHRHPADTAGPSIPKIARIELKGCRENNLKNVDVRIPLGGLICITGVSGSGKSTLINQTLLPALKRKLYGSKVKAGEHKSLNGIDQDRQSDRDRPEPHRPHAALQSRDLHRRLRRNPQASSPKPAKPKSAATRRADSASTSKAAAAKPARARAPSASRCTSCPMSTSIAKSATARATTPRLWKFTTAAKPSPMF